MLAQLAGRLGFRAEFEAVVEALPSR